MARMGPLRVHSTNPRYFAGADGRPILLCCSYTWANLATDQGAAASDFEGYLADLVTLGQDRPLTARLEPLSPGLDPPGP